MFNVAGGVSIHINKYFLSPISQLAQTLLLASIGGRLPGLMHRGASSIVVWRALLVRYRIRGAEIVQRCGRPRQLWWSIASEFR